MIEQIWINPEEGKDNVRVTEIELVAGSGIVGDHNFGKSQWNAQNVTFIESETIAQYNEEYNQTIALESTKRNIITSGDDLKSMVGHEFTIGDCRFKAVELCEPCSYLGDLLANETMTQAQVVKAFVHTGLRADFLVGGNVSAGMPFEVHPA